MTATVVIPFYIKGTSYWRLVPCMIFEEYVCIYIYKYDPGLAGALPNVNVGCVFSCKWEMWPLSLHCLIIIS